MQVALAGNVEKCAAKNGDVNADGNIGLSDAVTILGNLFLGNPRELVGLCALPPALSCLPATGQKACYGFNEKQDRWVEVPCGGAICAGQDGSTTTGCPSESRFVDNRDGTVTDTCTGLQWQQNTADVNVDGQSTEQDLVTWCKALAYCKNLSFAGHDDWRLPNVRELQSLVDYGRFAPLIDPVLGALSSFYWSSTNIVGSPGFVWGVGFDIGGVVNAGGGVSGNSYHVRAVRRGQ